MLAVAPRCELAICERSFPGRGSRHPKHCKQLRPPAGQQLTRAHCPTRPPATRLFPNHHSEAALGLPARLPCRPPARAAEPRAAVLPGQPRPVHALPPRPAPHSGGGQLQKARKPVQARSYEAQMQARPPARLGRVAALLGLAEARIAATAGRHCTRPTRAAAGVHHRPADPSIMNGGIHSASHTCGVHHVGSTKQRLSCHCPCCCRNWPTVWRRQGLIGMFGLSHPLVQGYHYGLGRATGLQRCLQVVQSRRWPRELQALLLTARLNSYPHFQCRSGIIGPA